MTTTNTSSTIGGSLAAALRPLLLVTGQVRMTPKERAAAEQLLRAHAVSHAAPAAPPPAAPRTSPPKLLEHHSPDPRAALQDQLAEAGRAALDAGDVEGARVTYDALTKIINRQRTR